MCITTPQVALSSVSVTGAGATIDLGRNNDTFTIMAETTGTPTTCNVNLELSQNGTLWFTGASVNLNGGSANLGLASARVARYVRANVTTLSGGTSPTVSATIAGT